MSLLIVLMLLLVPVTRSLNGHSPHNDPSSSSSGQQDTVPPAGQRVLAASYTGIRAEYLVTARIVGESVVDPSDPVVRVAAVDSGSPAERAGISVRDVILEIDGARLRWTTDLEKLAPGVSYVLRIRRGGDEVEVTLVPGPPRR
jgi:S1-C subfamily serine protease